MCVWVCVRVRVLDRPFWTHVGGWIWRTRGREVSYKRGWNQAGESRLESWGIFNMLTLRCRRDRDVEEFIRDLETRIWSSARGRVWDGDMSLICTCNQTKLLKKREEKWGEVEAEGQAPRNTVRWTSWGMLLPRSVGKPGEMRVTEAREGRGSTQSAVRAAEGSDEKCGQKHHWVWPRESRGFFRKKSSVECEWQLRRNEGSNCIYKMFPES